MGVNRFRPNLHVEGCRAFEEDEMRALLFSKALGTLRLPLAAWRLRPLAFAVGPMACSNI